MKEELRLVESFEELRAGMIVVVNPCDWCRGLTHRGLLVPYDAGFRLLPPGRCEFMLQTGVRRIGRDAIAAGAIFRVIDGLGAPSTPARGTRRLFVTDLYPGNTFKGWGRI